LGPYVAAETGSCFLACSVGRNVGLSEPLTGDLFINFPLGFVSPHNHGGNFRWPPHSETAEKNSAFKLCFGYPAIHKMESMSWTNRCIFVILSNDFKSVMVLPWQNPLRLSYGAPKIASQRRNFWLEGSSAHLPRYHLSYQVTPNTSMETVKCPHRRKHE
jgi:hypothetical protein